MERLLEEEDPDAILEESDQGAHSRKVNEPSDSACMYG
jgi:hypothetical protein